MASHRITHRLIIAGSLLGVLCLGTAIAVTTAHGLTHRAHPAASLASAGFPCGASVTAEPGGGFTASPQPRAAGTGKVTVTAALPTICRHDYLIAAVFGGGIRTTAWPTPDPTRPAILPPNPVLDLVDGRAAVEDGASLLAPQAPPGCAWNTTAMATAPVGVHIDPSNPQRADEAIVTANLPATCDGQAGVLVVRRAVRVAFTGPPGREVVGVWSSHDTVEPTLYGA